MARHAEALTSHERALAIKPNSAEMLCNRGIVLGELWRFGDGIRDCERALAIQPVLPKAEFAMACMRLAIGDFKTGLELYEARYVKRKMPQPQWDGKTALAGKTILLHHEQGYGDTIQFCRYVPLVAQQTHVVFVVPRALRRLLATLSGGVDIVAADESLPRFDTHCPLPSLRGHSTQQWTQSRRLCLASRRRPVSLQHGAQGCQTSQACASELPGQVIPGLAMRRRCGPLIVVVQCP